MFMDNDSIPMNKKFEREYSEYAIRIGKRHEKSGYGTIIRE
jgi:hypothetical protein